MNFIFLALGLAGLWLGTKWVINGAFGVAKRFNLSHTFVGLAILALCTDLPELFVSINASILHLQGTDSSGIITGNAIGSCIAQIAIILGISGLFLNIKMIRKMVFRDGIVLLLSILILFGLSYDGFISRVEGVILILSYVSYYYVLIKTQTSEDHGDSTEKNYTGLQLILFLLFGFIMLLVSSHAVISNAMNLAENWGVAQSFVGIVLVGVGTSLPELAVSVGAALRKSPGMSIGNIIGSNIFDTLIPIGVGGVISTTNMDRDLLWYDLPFLFGITLLTVLFLLTKRGISKRESIILILFYFIYLGVKIIFFEGTFSK